MNPENVWFVADHHFFHANILPYTSRGERFASMEEMHKYFIKEHNSKVQKNDWVFCLGDFSFGNKEQTASVVSQLRGKLFLVLGNHDKARSMKWWLDCGFDKVYDYPIIYDNFFMLSHEPIAFLNHHMPYLNIHGHLHDEEYKGSNRLNVSIEKNLWRPISFQGIKMNLELQAGKTLGEITADWLTQLKERHDA